MTTPIERRGPFINEDGDVWVPVTVGGISAARKVASEASWGGRMHFEGMEIVPLSLHEVGDERCAGGGDCTLNQPCSWTARTYHFREVER